MARTILIKNAADPLQESRQARMKLVHDGELPLGMLRDEIDASWRRSLGHGLSCLEGERHELAAPQRGELKRLLESNRLLIDAATLQAQLGQPGLALLDARAQPRFRGEVEPIDPVAGHIPGAQCAAFTDNLGSDGRFLPPEQLHQRFSALLRGRPVDELVAYCGSGVTACHNLFALSLAGFPLPRLYAGSWSEWITDPRRPVATGD